jgi:hypothetical protein
VQRQLRRAGGAAGVKERRDRVGVVLDDKVERVGVFACHHVLERAVRAVCRLLRIAVENMRDEAGPAQRRHEFRPDVEIAIGTEHDCDPGVGRAQQLDDMFGRQHRVDRAGAACDLRRPQRDLAREHMRGENGHRVVLRDTKPAKQVRGLPDATGELAVTQRGIGLRCADARDITNGRPVRMSRGAGRDDLEWRGVRQERGKAVALDRGDIGIRSDNPVHLRKSPLSH